MSHYERLLAIKNQMVEHIRSAERTLYAIKKDLEKARDEVLATKVPVESLPGLPWRAISWANWEEGWSGKNHYWYASPGSQINACIQDVVDMYLYQGQRVSIEFNGWQVAVTDADGYGFRSKPEHRELLIESIAKRWESHFPSNR